MADVDTPLKIKKERSPSFPFISLRKAVERAEALFNHHRREPARLSAVASSWGYSAKSSGLLQTVAALKQFGLIDDLGSGEDRKIALTKLGFSIIADSRPGAKESALSEAGKSPPIIAEYLTRWVPSRPSDAHCLSELRLDRGFTEEAARSFLKVFDETVSFASLSDSVGREDKAVEASDEENESAPVQAGGLVRLANAILNGPKPLKDRLQVSFNSQTLAVSATLETRQEAEQLIATVAAMKLLLPEKISGSAEEEPLGSQG